MKIDLVYPASVSGSENYSSEPPLGPIALFSSLSENEKKNTHFLDSTIISQKQIEELVAGRKAEIVAISCLTYNYKNALSIAQIAKKNGSIVICGGVHITHMRDKILLKMQKGERPIDFLVTGYGEPTFSSLVEALKNGSNLSNIPNLSYINNGKIIINHIADQKYGSDPLDVPLDYSKMNFPKYSANFKPFGNLFATKIPASTYTQRGCAQGGTHKCTFCSIEQMNPIRDPALFELDLFSLISEYSADHIRITDADFTVNEKHMKAIVDAAERVYNKTSSRPLVHCFARADEIDENRISLLKRLNTVSVLIGYESGSNSMLEVMQKNITVEQNLLATSRLKKHNIDVILGGIVLGAEGESEQTLSETLKFIKKLKQIGNTGAIMSTPLIPLPGSIAFNRLLKILSENDPGKYNKLKDSDDFDLVELIDLWNKYNCNVSVVRLLEFSNEIESMFPRGISLIKLN